MTQNSFIPFRKDLKKKARENRKNMNKPEARLWYEILSNRKLLGYRFLRQKPILNYILDFFCPKLNVGIEIDGESHDEHLGYDEKLTTNLNEIGIKLLRYSNAEVMCNLDGVYFDLEEKIKKREKELQE